MTGDRSAEGLDARVVVRRRDVTVDVRLHVPPGQVLALVGPNGAGKTTVVRALSGLLALDDGHVALDGVVLDDAGDGRFVPPAERAVGLVFQEHLLFPHLTAAANVAFGLRARGEPRRTAREQALHWLARVGLEGVADRMPRALSGGQAQRVALARALATRPRLLLLDEPLAALDASTRVLVRSELRRHLDAVAAPAVLVTHDALDALVLADHIAVVESGTVVQEGPAQHVAAAPRTDYVARLVGLNVLHGVAHGDQVQVDGGGRLVTAAAAAGRVCVAFPPSAVAVHEKEPVGGSPRNCWPGRVAGLEQHAETVRLRVDAQPPVLADVTAATVADLRLAVGTPVWCTVKATELRSYPE